MLVADGFFRGEVAGLCGGRLLPVQQRQLLRARHGDQLEAAKAVFPRTIKGRAPIRIDEHVIRIAHGAAEDVALAVGGFVPHPFPGVAREIEGPAPCHALMPPDGGETRPEIAQRHDGLGQPVISGTFPVTERGQPLAGEFRIGRGLEPTHPRHGIVGLVGGIGAVAPCRRAGPARAIHKQFHRLAPGERLAILEKGAFPEALRRVATAVHERLELAVGYFELVDQ